MKYRKMPYLDDKLSTLGFGCMRLPKNKEGKIDEEQALAMLHYAYENGVNYYDTAWSYHNGESEPLLGKFLSQIERNKVFIATKLPCWLVKNRADMDNFLEKQMEHLQTSYIDYYLLHSLNQKSWMEMKRLGVIDFLDKAKMEGKVRHLGFSFHDSYPAFKKILLAYQWDFCQFLLNYLDTNYQAGMNGYKLAGQNGTGIVAMEPLRGGKLAGHLPENVAAVWKKHNIRLSPVKFALRWVWNLEGCQVLLSGMSSLEQVKENVHYANLCKANVFDAKTLKIYKEVRREFLKRIPVMCSECRYCLPCPQKVAIPDIFGIYNDSIMFNEKDRHQKEYELFIPDESKADKCIACGACVSKCPRHINIPEEVKKIAEYFAECKVID
jgi:predicted aldo/keto reductase-like oxidoreductase